MLARNDVLLLSLTADGRLTQPQRFDAVRDRLRATTDCFVFCPGWVDDQAEARDAAERFFGDLDNVLRPLHDRVVPLRVAIHWPSKPFIERQAARNGSAARGSLDPAGCLGELARREPGSLVRVLPALCEAEVPVGPEEEFELDALARQARAARNASGLSPLHALSFWLTKRRAGQVGERLGRELLAPAIAELGHGAPRLHLIGHSFGARLATAAVLGVRPASLVLLQAAFSAFAFAEEVPTTKRPGSCRRIVTERMVSGPIVAVRSKHDRVLTELYPKAMSGQEVDRPQNPQLSRMHETVARSAMGAAGALGTGAVEMDLILAQKTGIPGGVVTIDGSRVVTREEWLIGAHCDVYHREIATLVLLAAGLVAGGRPRPMSPSAHA